MLLKLILILTFPALALAQEIKHYTPCPPNKTLYLDQADCPGICLEVPKGTDMEITVCSGSTLVTDTAKEDVKLQEKQAKQTEESNKDKDLKDLQKSNNPEIIKLLNVLGLGGK